MSTVLLVDDESESSGALGAVLRDRGHAVWLAETRGSALESLPRRPDIVLLGELRDAQGLEVFREIRSQHPDLPVVLLLSGTASSERVIEAMKLGALDFVFKPLNTTGVLRVLDRALEVRRQIAETTEPEPVDVPVPSHVMVGNCPAMQVVYKAIGRIASRNIPVLIRGESGTGKELVARAIVRHSNRSDKPFVPVNCAAIPDALLESELFGHERGAFTGAERRRIGRFEQCHGGTLFLDEIGDMDSHLQSRILRVLQEQRFERVGGNEVISTDVRILAATHRDLEEMVHENTFREDLLYRLAGYTLWLPPLRERFEDLPMLLDHCRRRTNRELGKRVRRFDDRALGLMQAYAWPGNVRELQSVVRRAIVETDGPVVMPEVLPRPLQSLSDDPFHAEDDARKDLDFRHLVATRLKESTGRLYDEIIDEVERRLFTQVLAHTDGNQSEAAELLGVTRTTLRTKLHKLGMAVRQSTKIDAGSDGASG